MRHAIHSPALKIVVSALLFLVVLNVQFAPAQENPQIDNARIVEMSKLGLGDDIIIAKIKTSRCKFALADNDLLMLKMSGVSDKVIAAMLEAGVLTSPRVLVEGKELELHTLGQSKVGGRLGRGLTLGIKSAKTKAYLQGPSAAVLTGPNPKIEVELPLNDSIENYLLVLMDGKDDRRELEVGAAGGIVGAKSGIRAESIIPTSANALGSNRFQLVTGPLKRGEYMIYIAGSADIIKGIHRKGYDFSVQ